MTGAGYKQRFLTRWGEVGSGYIDDTRMNEFIQTASYNVWDKKVEEFQETQKVTRETRQLINITQPITPSNATIDVAPGSSVVVDYYSIAALRVTAPYRNSSLTNYAKERPYDQFQSSFTEGDASDPRYFFSGTVLNIEPANATSCVLTYFKNPFGIDVTDDTIQIPYNIKLIELLISETINVVSVENRDQWMSQQSLLSEQKNP